MNEHQDRMEVIILTGNYRITGVIELFRGARLTDYLAEAGSFIAVTDAEVTDKDSQKILTASFLNVQRDNIELILPADLSGTT